MTRATPTMTITRFASKRVVSLRGWQLSRQHWTNATLHLHRDFGSRLLQQQQLVTHSATKSVCSLAAVLATEDVTAFVFLMVNVASLNRAGNQETLNYCHYSRHHPDGLFAPVCCYETARGRLMKPTCQRML